MSEKSELLRKQILELTAEYHAEAFPVREFVPGVSTVPVSGKVIGADDIARWWIRRWMGGLRRGALRRTSNGSWRGSLGCGRLRW